MARPISVFKAIEATDPLAPYKDGVAVSSTNTYYSKMWGGGDTDGYSLSVFYTGTMSGALTLWTTDKPNPDETSDADWIEDTLFTSTDPSGGPDKFKDDAANSKAFYKRLKYVNAAASGVIYAYVTVPTTA